MTGTGKNCNYTGRSTRTLVNTGKHEKRGKSNECST